MSRRAPNQPGFLVTLDGSLQFGNMFTASVDGVLVWHGALTCRRKARAPAMRDLPHGLALVIAAPSVSAAIADLLATAIYNDIDLAHWRSSLRPEKTGRPITATDPSSVFDQVEGSCTELLRVAAVAAYPNASRAEGCDMPIGTPVTPLA